MRPPSPARQELIWLLGRGGETLTSASLPELIRNQLKNQAIES
jgi:hypothetical protein